MNRAIPALAAVLLLAGCAATPPPAPTVTVTASPTPSPAASFPDDVRADGSDYWDAIDDVQITRLGTYVCDAFDEGNTVEDLGTLMFDRGVPVVDAAALISNAVADLCPEHQGDLS